MGKNIGRKKISKNLSNKYSQKKLLNHTKQPVSDVLKTTSKRAIKKTTAAIGDFICNKIADETTSNSIRPMKKGNENSAENSSKTTEKLYIFPEKR